MGVTGPPQPPPSAPAASTPTKLYFAYGSNLHIKQMWRRCPKSRFIGHARLSNHRWQINERGFANIVETSGRNVDGLVYEIDNEDEAKLDLKEGVRKDAYQKRFMTVLLNRAQGCLYRRPVSWIVDKGGPAALCRGNRRGWASLASRPPRQYLVSDVLVYISFNHVKDGTPRDEYVSRLNLGIIDAKVLGFDEDYIRSSIRPFIPEASSSPIPNEPPANGCNKHSSSSRTGRLASAPKVRTLRPDQQNHNRALVRVPLNSGIPKRA